MAKTVAAPQVPGAPAADPAAGADTAVDPKADAKPKADANAEGSAETVSVQKEQLEALLARVAALESAQQNPVGKRANPEEDLPDQDTVDASKLKSPVLTKQGWVLPNGFGSQAAKTL